MVEGKDLDEIKEKIAVLLDTDRLNSEIQSMLGSVFTGTIYVDTKYDDWYE